MLVADSDKFTYPLAEPWAQLVQLVQQKNGYSHVIAASGSFGKNILPRAAALLDVSPVTDVVAITESRQFLRFILFFSPKSLTTVTCMQLSELFCVLYMNPDKCISH